MLDDLPETLDCVEIDKVLAKRSLVEFVRQAWHVVEPNEAYIHGPPVEAIAAHLQAVTEGEITRLLMEVPPGSMKSLLTNVFWFAWEWGPRGLSGYRHIGAANNMSLAVRDNTKARRLIESEWFQSRWPLILTSDQNAKTKFESADTGFREAKAIGSLTGSRGNRLLIDDPHTRDSAMSAQQRESECESFFGGATDRLSDVERDAIVVIQQRLHKRDLAGQIVERDLGYTHLSLPMEFIPTTRCVTAWFTDERENKGDLLFSERFSRKAVDALRKAKGANEYASQYQQAPTDQSNALYKADWLGSYDAVPPDLHQGIIRIDTATRDTKSADHTAAMLMASERSNNSWLYGLDGIRGKWGFHDMTLAMADFIERHVNLKSGGYQVSRVDVEDANVGPALVESLRIQMRERLKNTGHSVLINLAPRKGNKFDRAERALPHFEQGKFLLPSRPTKFTDRGWVGPFRDEFTQFSAADTHASDDMLDPVVYRVLEHFGDEDSFSHQLFDPTWLKEYDVLPITLDHGVIRIRPSDRGAGQTTAMLFAGDRRSGQTIYALDAVRGAWNLPQIAVHCAAFIGHHARLATTGYRVYSVEIEESALSESLKGLLEIQLKGEFKNTNIAIGVSIADVEGSPIERGEAAVVPFMEGRMSLPRRETRYSDGEWVGWFREEYNGFNQLDGGENCTGLHCAIGRMLDQYGGKRLFSGIAVE